MTIEDVVDHLDSLPALPEANYGWVMFRFEKPRTRHGKRFFALFVAFQWAEYQKYRRSLGRRRAKMPLHKLFLNQGTI